MNESLWSRPSSSNHKQGNSWIFRPRITKPLTNHFKIPENFEVNVPTFFFAGALWCLPKCGFKGGHTKTHHRFTKPRCSVVKILKNPPSWAPNRWHVSLHTQMRGKACNTFPSPSWIFGALASTLGFCRCFWRSKRAFSRRLRQWRQNTPKTSACKPPLAAPTFKIIQIHLPSKRVFCGRISDFCWGAIYRFFFKALIEHLFFLSRLPRPARPCICRLFLSYISRAGKKKKQSELQILR